MSDGQLEEAARLFGVLAEPSRLILLRELMNGPMSVTELGEATGMKQGNVSKHLGVLHSARFIQRQRNGNFVHYEICDHRLVQLCELICARIHDDIQTLALRLG